MFESVSSQSYSARRIAAHYSDACFAPPGPNCASAGRPSWAARNRKTVAADALGLLRNPRRIGSMTASSSRRRIPFSADGDYKPAPRTRTAAGTVRVIVALVQFSTRR